MDNIMDNIISKYFITNYIVSDFIRDLSNRINTEYDVPQDGILPNLGRNLSKLHRENKLPKIIGRSQEIQRIITILSRTTKSNPMLVGEAGVGKTAVIEKLASVIDDNKNIPYSLHGLEIFEIDMSKLLAMGAPAGEMEKIIPEIVKEAENKYILFIDEAHLLNSEEGRIINLLKPAMARGTIKLIGATTEDEFKVFEKDEAILRRFGNVKIAEPDSAAVFDICKTKAEAISEVHDVIIPHISILKAIKLSDQYRQNKKQPDKAIDLLEESAATLRMFLETKPEE
jgi:ATP-dependent Clp protease ATP-binding subunit ClpB